MFRVTNDQFQKFVEFANRSSGTAIAGLSGDDSLATREIQARTGDFVGNVGRNLFTKNVTANNEAREVFRQSVVNIFGGDEKNIPPSVRNAMLMGDYDCGKPLTARRIIKVRDAIDREVQNAFEAEGTRPGEMEKLATDAGYLKEDFCKLNLAANLHARSSGLSLKDALLDVIDKKSVANAVMQRGAPYTESANAFQDGVNLHKKNRETMAAARQGVASDIVNGQFSNLKAFADAFLGDLRMTIGEIYKCCPGKERCDLERVVKADWNAGNVLKVAQGIAKCKSWAEVARFFDEKLDKFFKNDFGVFRYFLKENLNAIEAPDALLTHLKSSYENCRNFVAECLKVREAGVGDSDKVRSDLANAAKTGVSLDLGIFPHAVLAELDKAKAAIGNKDFDKYEGVNDLRGNLDKMRTDMLTFAADAKSGNCTFAEVVDRIRKNKDFSNFAVECRKVAVSLATDSASPEAVECAKTLRTIGNQVKGLYDDYGRIVDDGVVERETADIEYWLQRAVEIARTSGKSANLTDSMMEEVKGYIRKSGQKAVTDLKKFRSDFVKNGDEALRFNKDQIQRLNSLVTEAVGGERAKAVAENLVRGFEKVLFTNAVKRSAEGKAWGGGVAESVVAHLEKNPGVLGLMNRGFDMGRSGEVMKSLGNALCANLEEALRKDDNFTRGVFSLSLREYNPGYVTFNGQKLPPAASFRDYGGKADNDDRRGFGEFLEDTFKDVKMRKAVSLACSMANGIIGVIDGARDGTLEGGSVPMTGVSVNGAMMKHNAIAASGLRNPRDNQDISIDEKGNVTIKVDLHSSIEMKTLMNEGKAINCGRLDTSGPVLARSRYTAIVTITPPVKEGDMPGIAFTGFTQDVVDGVNG